MHLHLSRACCLSGRILTALGLASCSCSYLLYLSWQHMHQPLCAQELMPALLTLDRRNGRRRPRKVEQTSRRKREEQRAQRRSRHTTSNRSGCRNTRALALQQKNAGRRNKRRKPRQRQSHPLASKSADTRSNKRAHTAQPRWSMKMVCPRDPVSLCESGRPLSLGRPPPISPPYYLCDSEMTASLKSVASICDLWRS
jgi:hypothetical protein